MLEIRANSFRRFRAVAGQELRTHLAGPLFWFLVLLAGLATATIDPTALIPSDDATAGAERLFINSRYAVAQGLGLVSFFVYSFFAAIMAGLSALREDENRISDLLRSTPLSRAEHVCGKLAGIGAALGLALAFHVLIAIGLIQLAPGWNPEAVRGPFRIAHFLLPALAFAAPGIWFSAGLAFAVGNRTRQPMAVFAVPTALFLITVYGFNSWTFSGLSPFVETLLMVLDPSGLRWLRQTAFSVDRGAAFYNTAPFGFDTAFLLCRLFAIGAPLLAIVASLRHAGRPRRTVAPAQNLPDTKPITFGLLGDLGMTRSAPSFLAGTMNTFRAELRELRAQPGLYLFALLIVAMVAEFALSAEIHDTPLLLTAGVIAVGTVEVITFLVCLLLLFSTVESVSRERSTRFASILYASPLRTGALLLGKSLASAVLAGVILAICAALSLALLGLQEQGRVEVWPFVLVWGLVLIPSFFLWSAFVTAVLAIVRERTAAYAIGLTVLMLTGYQAVSGSATWLTNWTLTGALRWSDMGVFELNGTALIFNRVMAAGLGLFFAAVAVRFFARAEHDPAAMMHRLRPASLLRGALRLAPFTLLPLAVGSVLAARIESGFQGEAAAGRAKAYWQRNVATWAAVEPAAVTHVDLKIDLDPRQRSAAIAGSFRMINPTEKAMRRLPFTIRPPFRHVAWMLDGIPAKSDDRSGLHVLTPASPLLPGAEIQVGFAYSAVFPEGVTKNGGGVEQFVLPSGVALHTLRDSFLPVPGFVDEDEHVEEDATLGPAVGNAVPFTTRIEITAPSAYTVNSVGERTSAQTHNGRTTVVWESEVPVRALNIVAGRWNVRRHNGAAVFYHPAHPYNVDEMLRALAASRQKYSEWFAGYPWTELRLSEFPNEVANAQGFPTNIPFSEGIGFLTRSGPGARLAFMVTAHEAAHQWWGNLLNPGDGPGADVLIEGMAHYSTLLLLESELGLQERIGFATLLEERYGGRRRADLELPLVADDDETVVQDKGAWVMWMLHNHLGRDRMLAGLREFIRRYHAPEDGSFPVLRDLVETLRPYAADPTAYQAFIDQWFFGVVLPQYRVRDAAAVESGGRWNVSATVENVGTGTADVELAVVRGARSSKKTLRLAPAQPRQVTWTLAFKPERIVVDPDVLVLQRDRQGAFSDLR